MGVTEVVRGRDLLLSTPQQIHLRQTIASLSSPHEVEFRKGLHFIHHPLLVNENGQRLCKRDLSMDLGILQEKHTSPKEIIGRLAHLAGIIPEPTPTLPQDLLPFFTWQKVPKEDITVEEL